MSEPLTEGWQDEKHPSQRVYHYIRGQFSLCGSLGFYRGDLMPDAPEKRTQYDCKACIRKLDRVAHPRQGSGRAPGTEGDVSKPAGERYTVAVDFDGVLHLYETPWVNAETISDGPVDGAIEWLEEIGEDFNVVIFTTRGKTPEGVAAVRAWLVAQGWPAGGDVKVTAEKPPALVYLDDRAMRFEGVFPSAQEIRDARPWNEQTFTRSAPSRSCAMTANIETLAALLREHISRDGVPVTDAWIDGLAARLAARGVLCVDALTHEELTAAHIAYRDGYDEIAARIPAPTWQACAAGATVAMRIELRRAARAAGAP